MFTGIIHMLIVEASILAVQMTPLDDDLLGKLSEGSFVLESTCPGAMIILDVNSRVKANTSVILGRGGLTVPWFPNARRWELISRKFILLALVRHQHGKIHCLLLD